MASFHERLPSRLSAFTSLSNVGTALEQRLNKLFQQDESLAEYTPCVDLLSAYYDDSSKMTDRQNETSIIASVRCCSLSLATTGTKAQTHSMSAAALDEIPDGKLRVVRVPKWHVDG